MKLATDEPRVVRQFDDLDKITIDRTTGHFQPSRFEFEQITIIDLVTVTMALLDRVLEKCLE